MEMQSRLVASQCLGLDDMHVKLILAKKIPDLSDGQEAPRTLRLIEKMQEAQRDKKDSWGAKMWGYSSLDSNVPKAIFDFRFSSH